MKSYPVTELFFYMAGRICKICRTIGSDKIELLCHYQADRNP